MNLFKNCQLLLVSPNSGGSGGFSRIFRKDPFSQKDRFFLGKSQRGLQNGGLSHKFSENSHGGRANIALKGPFLWAAANGGVTNGGLRRVWPPFLEIGRNRPFSPFFCPFCPFPEGAKSTWRVQKRRNVARHPGPICRVSQVVWSSEKPCRAPEGGAATLASIAQHFDTKP